MKFNRRQLTPRTIPDSGKNLFALRPIIINIIAIIVMAVAYYFIIRGNLFPDYQTYIYWIVNVVISYNILIAAARTFLGPILTLAAGLGFLFTSMFYNINLLSSAECWQLIVLGVVGFLITILLKL